MNDPATISRSIHPEKSTPAAGLRTDNLAASVVLMLAMTVIQRLFGFAREIILCRWLDPVQLGEWNLVFGYLNLAAPLAMLGIPGSFGRYAEHFRQRSQLRLFLYRTTVTTAVSCCVFVGVLFAIPRPFARLIFGNEDQVAMVYWSALALAALAFNNFVCSLFVAMRLARVVNLLQFVQSLAFALLSVALLATWTDDARAVIVGFAIAYAMTSLFSLHWVRRIWHATVSAELSLAPREFWARLAPFAVAMWTTNLLANLFDLADRYMLVHHSGLSASDALREVGNYHSSRVIPVMGAMVATMFGAMITPHLSHDWESGRRDLVADRLNRVLKILGLLFLATFLAVEIGSPMLFATAFGGKFAGGLAVLPWTLTYCSWYGLMGVAQNYLWCAERARLGSVAMFVGLFLNVVLNLMLLPTFGLHGAVWSTAAANLAALLLIYAFSQQHGMRLHLGTWLLSIAPCALGFGPVVAGGTLVVLVVFCIRGERLFSTEERRFLHATMARHWAGWVQRVRNVKPAAT